MSDPCVRPKNLLISARSDIGGGPAHMFDLAAGLEEHFEVYAALPSDGHFHRRFEALLGQDHLCEIPRQRFTFRDVIRLVRFCRRNHIDLVHSHGKGAGVYSRLLGILLGLPVVHTLHGYHDGQYRTLLKKVYALWESVAAIFTKKIICVSASEQNVFLDKTWGASSKTVVVPNGTPVQPLSGVAVLPNKVVTVARFDYQKNLIECLDIAGRMPDCVFHIVGDGEGRAEVEAYIARHKITNVVLHGASLTVLSDIADAEVYLSTSHWEGLPLALLEAMSLGIPVVASDVVGNRDAVVVGTTGYLYPLGDIEACVRAIQQARFLPRSEIRSRHEVSFSSERMVAETVCVYQQARQQVCRCD